MTVDHSTTIRVDLDTVQRLRDRERFPDESYDDIVNRLLDDTDGLIDMEDVVRFILNTYDTVSAIGINTMGFDDGVETCYIDAWVGSGEYERSPDLFRDGQCVEFGGEEVPIASGLRTGIPDIFGHVPLYSAEFPDLDGRCAWSSKRVQQIGPVPVEEGIEKAVECLHSGIPRNGLKELWNAR